MATARQEILERLKNAVHSEPEKPDMDAPVYFSIQKPLEQAFKENMKTVNGNVYSCVSEEALIARLKDILAKYQAENICCRETALQDLLSLHNIHFLASKKLPKSIDVGITSCEYLVAHTASVMVSSAIEGGRQAFVYPPVHIVIARKNQLVDYLAAAYKKIQNKYGDSLPSQITLITGPSRTADIEKTLVLGAHDPRELHVFIY